MSSAAKLAITVSEQQRRTSSRARGTAVVAVHFNSQKRSIVKTINRKYQFASGSLAVLALVVSFWGWQYSPVKTVRAKSTAVPSEPVRAIETRDASDLLVLRFDNSLNGEGGETPTTATGTSFQTGVSNQGALLPNPNQLFYAAANNINATEGTFECWVKPTWNGNDNQDHFFLSYGGGGGMLIGKDAANNLKVLLNRFGGAAEVGSAFNISNWQANQWHYLAFTWSNTSKRLQVFIDGVLKDERSFTINLPAISSTTFQIGGDGAGGYANAVVDNLRISNAVRSPQEISNRLVEGVTVNSWALNPVTTAIELWPTWYWWINPTITANTNVGTLSLPVLSASWSSSDPGVALLEVASGRFKALAPGSAVLTGTLGGASASFTINVFAPPLPAVEESIDPYLATPASNYLYKVPVVIIRYLPTTDGLNLSPAICGLNDPLSEIKPRVERIERQHKFMLEEGSRFRGYGNPTASATLGYQVVKIITVYEDIPPGFALNANEYFPDYNQILARWGGEQLVNQLGVKEFWIWHYHFGRIVPNESNMSSPTTGDVSNSYRTNNDQPVFNRTYVTYGLNFGGGVHQTTHNHGHQLESIYSHANLLQDGNTNLFVRQFVGNDANGFQPGRSGDTHHPPNARFDYDWENPGQVLSDIEDWNPANTGVKTLMNFTRWQNLPYAWPPGDTPGALAEAHWYIYWMQAMPGRGNVIPHGANRMTNWWQFTGDWDAAIQAGLGLYESNTCNYTLAATSQSFAAAGGNSSVNVTSTTGCKWFASSNEPWITLTGGRLGNGSGAVTYTVAANPGNARTGTIAIAGQVYTVTQSSNCPTITVNPANPALPGGATSSQYNQTFTQTGSGNTITFSLSNGVLPNGLTLNAATGALTGIPYAAGTFNFTVRATDANTCFGERAYTLVINPACNFTLAPTSASFSTAGGNASINITTQTGCVWTAVSNTAWITITSGTNGSGNGMTLFTVAANTGRPRGGTLTIAGQRVIVFQAGSRPGTTITVNSTSDIVANDGACTLREALINANNDNQTGSTDCARGTGTDMIAFNIPGAGPHTISPLSPLPVIYDQIIIDGTTQPGASCTTLGGLKIELSGAGAGGGESPLYILGGYSTVRGLVINRFLGDGVLLHGLGGSTVSCNYIGTDVAGTTDLGNGRVGVRSFNSPNNLIGGTAVGAGNLLSGNNEGGVILSQAHATSNLIQGNYIGTDVTGTAAIGNSAYGVLITVNANGNKVGGTTTDTRNVISGNGGTGVYIQTSSNTVQGNYIGTNAAGTSDLGNGFVGIELSDNTTGNLIGGPTANARNVVSGNDVAGIYINNTNNHTVQNNFVGTNAAGTAALGNTDNGIVIINGSNNLIGGAGAGNVSSANVRGLYIAGNAFSNLIKGNYFGTNATGTAALGNQRGIMVTDGASNNQIGGTAAGEGNLISGNTATGLLMDGLSVGNAILSNSIHTNNGLGIDFHGNGITANDTGDGDTGPNNLQNFPVLTAASSNGASTAISGSLNSTANTTFTIQFFSNATCDSSGNGEGQVFLGQTTVTTDANGNTAINATLATAVASGSLITATATDAANNTSEFSQCRVVDAPCPAITINPPTLPNGTIGAAYNQTFIQTGGTGPITFSLTGTLPSGLTFNAATATLSGTAAQSGTFNFTVKATAANNCMGTQAYVLVINCPPLTVNPPTLPNGQVSQLYSQQLTQTGGTGAITYTISAATLPGGLTLNANTGVLAGTPLVTGTFNFTIRATDANSCFGERQYGLSVTCATLNVSPLDPTLPLATLGQAYNQSFTQTGGTGALTWSNPGGDLPGGLTLNSGTGALTGTPTATGTFVFVVRVSDANSCVGERQYSLTINPMPCPTISVSPATATNGFSGVAYSQTFNQTGGAGTITWSVSAGALPSGLSLNLATGVLSGTPMTVGTFTFTLKATDANNCMGARQYTVIVSGAGLQFYPLAAPVRLLDTRTGASPNACSQPNAPIAGGTSRLQPARNFCGIPANAQALTGNITTVQSGGGYLTLYPSGAQQPTVASTNYGANEVVNNVFTVGLGAGDGAFNIFAQMTTEVVVDVTGYYAPPNTNGLYFHPLPAPVRLLETRAGQPIGCVKPGTPLVGGADSLQTATTPCTGIPAAARSVVGNATTVEPAGIGYLTLYPADVASAPLVASSNYGTNQIVNGPFTVGLSPSGQFKIFTTHTTELVVDVLGYFSPDAVDANGAGLLFTPLARPVRLLETRANPPNLTGCFKPNAPLNGNQVYTQIARGVCDSLTIPAAALAVVGNATVVFPVSGGYLTLWPNSALQPTVATSNYKANDVVNRHFIVGLGQADGAFKLFAAATTELVLDLSGYFAP